MSWVGVPFVDGGTAALVLRHTVFRLLQGEGLLSRERMRLLLSWRHSGFGVHTSVAVPPDDRGGLERLARHLAEGRVGGERRAAGSATTARGAGWGLCSELCL